MKRGKRFQAEDRYLEAIVCDYLVDVMAFTMIALSTAWKNSKSENGMALSRGFASEAAKFIQDPTLNAADLMAESNPLTLMLSQMEFLN